MACCKFEVLGSSRVVELASGCRLPKHHNTVFQQYCGGAAGGYSSTTQFFSSIVEALQAATAPCTTQFFSSIVEALEAAKAPQH